MPAAGGLARTATSNGQWTFLIDDIVAGRWVNPETGDYATVPYDSIVIADSLDGAEADLVRDLGLGPRLAVVFDQATEAALGERVAQRLGSIATVERVVLDAPHADMRSVEDLAARTRGVDALVAVGSGTINDLCKYVTSCDGRRYCVFPTASSMNGYTSTTASITLDSGLKVSLRSHAPSGCFWDLSVSASAPKFLAASGFADCIARSVAQVDWWLSHRLLGSAYSTAPYVIQDADEAELNRRAASLPAGDIEAFGYLSRVLTLCGLGISFAGTSSPGSMGEHQISHYIDCFAGDRHPGTLHGQQVGVASLTLARVQQSLLASETPPKLKPTEIDPQDMAQRMGREIAAQCYADIAPKRLDAVGAEALNKRLAELWPALREETRPMMIPVSEMESLLRSAGAPVSAKDLGLCSDFYHEAVLHAREMRNRFSFLDLAADARLLESFVTTED